jgi:hypothetical protein
MDSEKFEDVDGGGHLEMASDRPDEKHSVPVKLDNHGFPLVPQPSEHKTDPLNWNKWLKIAVLAQISAISFLSLLAASLIVSPQSMTSISG